MATATWKLHISRFQELSKSEVWLWSRQLSRMMSQPRLIIVLDHLVERGSNKMCTARASWHGPKNPFKQLWLCRTRQTAPSSSSESTAGVWTSVGTHGTRWKSNVTFGGWEIRCLRDHGGHVKEFGAAMCPCYVHIVNFCMMHISKTIFKTSLPLIFTSL